MEICFEKTKLILNDKYLIYKDLENEKETRIKKNKIKAFYLGRSTFTNTKIDGSMNVRIRVSDGTYIKKSQPHYRNTTHVKYSPQIILKNGDTYFLGNVFEHNKSFYDVTKNIDTCNEWIKSNNVNKNKNWIGLIIIIILLFMVFFNMH